MELRNVKTFVKVAEFGNFSKAAEELGYAQSTVTVQIQSLEKELDVELFERNGKRVSLSDAGAEFLPFAYQMLKCEAMALDAFQKESEPHGQLTIAIVESLCASSYMEGIHEFIRRYPKVQLKMVLATTYQAMDMLDKGTVDFLFTLDQRIYEPHWTTAYEKATKVQFFCASDHVFSKMKVVELEDMIEEPFIMVEEGCNYRQVFETYLASQGKNLKNVLEIGHTKSIIDAVEAHLGISLLPDFTLREELDRDQIAIVPLRDYQMQLWVQIIYSKNKWMSPAMQSFVKTIGNFFEYGV